MADLIDRQAVMDALAKLVPYAIYDVPTESYTNGLTDAYNLICQLPSAQPGWKKGHWIPCSTDFPKKNGDYLVTTHSGQLARYIFNKGTSEEYWARCVTAWMPLPEPYKGERK